jgi:8-oxo-dGTP pyrophosphatase MutT (NUDIX family)
MAWKQLSSKSVYKNKWMEITEEQVVTDFDKQLTYGIVRKKPAVLLIPWDGTHLYLVGQYRYPVDEYSWEFAQGHFEHDSIVATAKTELLEETGLTAGQLKEIATFNLAPGHHTQKYFVFLATELVAGQSQPEAAELGIKLKKVTLAELQDMIAKNFIKDSPTITAFGIIIAKNLLK